VDVVVDDSVFEGVDSVALVVELSPPPVVAASFFESLVPVAADLSDFPFCA